MNPTSAQLAPKNLVGVTLEWLHDNHKQGFLFDQLKAKQGLDPWVEINHIDMLEGEGLYEVTHNFRQQFKTIGNSTVYTNKDNIAKPPALVLQDDLTALIEMYVVMMVTLGMEKAGKSMAGEAKQILTEFQKKYAPEAANATATD